MKKYKFTIRGNQYDVDIVEIEDNMATIEVNGSEYQVEIHKKTVSASKTPKLVRKAVVPSGDSGQAKTSQPSASKGTGAVKAPLPGTILEVKTAVGNEVKSGDTLLIMEAMKMENEIKAGKSGKVTAIKVNVGDAVLENDVLVEIGG